MDSAITGFSRSLFERLLMAGFSKTMLEIQYRMHPCLRKFPSQQFYEDRIMDHETVLPYGSSARPIDLKLRSIEKAFKGRRLLFVDLRDSRESRDDDRSKRN